MSNKLFFILFQFQTAYLFRAHEIYAAARFKSQQNSMEKARRPEALPQEGEIRRLNAFIQSELERERAEVNYIHVRNLVVTRLTLFNARRGEEASRLTVKQAEDALAGVWLPEELVEKVTDDAEKFLMGKFHLAYLTGKGRKFVPILMPNDVIQHVRDLLACREEQGIPSSNPFLFASRVSKSHCSGWHAINKICKMAGVKPLTATGMRHKVSTIYASLDMPEKERQTFFDHMGHEARVNEENYQCPMSFREVRVMGKFLHDFHATGMLFGLKF